MTGAPSHIAAIIVAAGSGERAGLGYPKQFAKLRGKPMLRWSAQAFAAYPAISRIIIVHGANQEGMARSALTGIDADYIPGGATRQQSVACGLSLLSDTPPEAVLVHDAARPFLPTRVIDDLIAALADHDGAIPVLPVADTIVTADGQSAGDVVDRALLRRVQTPQAFRYALLADAHGRWTGEAATDDAQMVRANGGRIAMVEGAHELEKFTFADDFSAAPSSEDRIMRTAVGMGFDVHRFEEGAELWLGGVLIPYHLGLSGHSDADVAIHALTDAVLGALGEGDIGTHFPPSDPNWRGAASHRFLAFACERVLQRGGRIDHMDVTIICEAPRIGPHRAAIRSRISAIAGISEDRVSIKATTTEKLGFTGRGEGMAAQAVATIALPLKR